MNFSFFCLVCNKKGNEKKKCFLFLIFLCPYKCERCIKIMDKWTLIFFKPLVPSNLPKFGRLQIYGPRETVSTILFSSMLTKQGKRLNFLSFLFSSSFIQCFQIHCKIGLQTKKILQKHCRDDQNTWHSLPLGIWAKKMILKLCSR